MSPDDWRALGEIVGLVGLGLYTAWKARKAEKYAKPTGNGFAKKVIENLERLEKGQIRNDKANARIEQKIDNHIAAHANAELASHPRRILRDVNEL